MRRAVCQADAHGGLRDDDLVGYVRLATSYLESTTRLGAPVFLKISTFARNNKIRTLLPSSLLSLFKVSYS